jgi:hypothetical protein
MSEPRPRFSRVRQVLTELGFQRVAVTKPFIGFQHGESDTLIVLPSYRGNSPVAPHHLAQVRIMLDAKGLMDADEFDRLVAVGLVRHTPLS